MFDIGWSELLLIGVIALIVVGPKELPGLLYNVGQWVRRARMLASNFQSTVDQMMREAELEKARKDVEKDFREHPMEPAPYRPPAEAEAETDSKVVNFEPPARIGTFAAEDEAIAAEEATPDDAARTPEPVRRDETGIGG